VGADEEEGVRRFTSPETAVSRSATAARSSRRHDDPLTHHVADKEPYRRRRAASSSTSITPSIWSSGDPAVHKDPPLAGGKYPLTLSGVTRAGRSTQRGVTTRGCCACSAGRR